MKNTFKNEKGGGSVKNLHFESLAALDEKCNQGRCNNFFSKASMALG